jgi:hypothetical protein
MNMFSANESEICAKFSLFSLTCSFFSNHGSTIKAREFAKFFDLPHLNPEKSSVQMGFAKNDHLRKTISLFQETFSTVLDLTLEQRGKLVGVGDIWGFLIPTTRPGWT